MTCGQNRVFWLRVHSNFWPQNVQHCFLERIFVRDCTHQSGFQRRQSCMTPCASTVQWTERAGAWRMPHSADSNAAGPHFTCPCVHKQGASVQCKLTAQTGVLFNHTHHKTQSQSKTSTFFLSPHLLSKESQPVLL